MRNQPTSMLMANPLSKAHALNSFLAFQFRICPVGGGGGFKIADIASGNQNNNLKISG